MSIFDQREPEGGAMVDPFAPLDQIQETEPDWEWKPLERMKYGAKQTVGSLFGLGSLGAEMLHLEDASEWAAAKAGDWFESADNQDLVQTGLFEIRNPIDAAKWAAEVLPTVVPDLLGVAIGGVGLAGAGAKIATTAGGKTLLKTAAKKGFQKNYDTLVEKSLKEGLDVTDDFLIQEAVKNTAKDLGRLSAVAGYSGSLGAGGSWLTDLEMRGEDASPLMALGSGALQGAISVLSPIDRAFAGKLPKGKKSVLGMTLGESAEELGQEAISMAHEAGIDTNKTFKELLVDEEGWKRLVESGAAGALVGGTFAGPIRAFSGKPKDDEAVTPREPEWKENLKSIVDQREVIDTPEVILEEAGIPTGKPTSVGFEPPELAQVGLEKEPGFQLKGTTTADEDVLQDYQVNQYEPELPMEQRVDLTEPPQMSPLPEGTPVVSEEMSKEVAVKNLQDYYTEQYFENDLVVPGTVVKKETNLAKRTADRKALEVAKSKANAGEDVGYKEPTTTLIAPKEEATPKATGVTEVTFDESGEAAPKGRRIIVEPKRAKVTTDKEGWTKAGNKQTKELPDTNGHKAEINKKNNDSWSVTIKRPDEDGGDYNLGTFKRQKDAKEAQAKGLTPEEYYGVKEPKVEEKLTAEQKTLIEDADVEKAIGIGLNRVGDVDDIAEATSVANSALIQAAKDYKVGSKASFQSYATTKIIGALKDYKKGVAKTGLWEQKEATQDVEEGSEREGILSMATGEEDVVQVDFEGDETPVTVGDQTVYLHKEGKNWVDRDGKDYGVRKDEAVKEVKKALAPEVKSVSVEDYLKEKGKAAPKAKAKPKLTEESPNLVERNKRRKVVIKPKSTDPVGRKDVGDKKKPQRGGLGEWKISGSAQAIVDLNKILEEPGTKKTTKETPKAKPKETPKAKAPEEIYEKVTFEELKKASQPEIDAYEDWIIDNYQIKGDDIDVTMAQDLWESRPQAHKDYVENKRKEWLAEEDKKSPEQQKREYREEMLSIAKADSPKATIKNNMKGGAPASVEFNTNFLKHLSDAEMALKYAGHVNDNIVESVSKATRVMSEYVADKIGTENLKKIKIEDSSKFKRDHPQIWMNSYGSDSKVPIAFYYAGKVYVNKAALPNEGSNNQIAQVLLHEIVHAATLNNLRESKNKQNLTDIENLLETVRDEMLTIDEYNTISLKYNWDANKAVRNRKEFLSDLTRFGGSTYYGTLNVDEFLAEAFSNSEFQKQLAKIPLKKPEGGGKIRTLWDKFVKVIANVLGFKKASDYTALDAVLSLGTDVMNAELVTEGRYSNTPSAILAATAEPEDWGGRVRMMNKNTSGRGAKDYLAEGAKSFKDLARDTLKSSSEVLRKIDPRLIKPLRKFEMEIVESNVEARKLIKGFVDKYKGLSSSDKNLLDLTLMNDTDEDIKKRNEVLRKNGMTSDYRKVEELLKSIYKSKERLGLTKYGEKAGYFPRLPKDLDKLKATMAGDPEYNVLQTALEGIESKEERDHIVEEMINTGTFPARTFKKLSSDQQRKIKRVSSKWKHHYANTPEALLNHIYTNNEAIAAHGMFSDNPARNKLVRERNKKYEALKAEGLTEAKRAKLTGEIQLIEDNLKDPEREYEALDSFLAKESPNLTNDEIRAAINVFRARLNQKGMHGPMAGFRNIALISALSSPTSAITQIGDLAFSIYKNGPKETVKAMFGPKMITAKDLDLENSMREFQTEGTAKWLDKALTISGLKSMDMFGKNTSINASLGKAKSQSLAEFTKQWYHALGKDTEQTYNDIKAGKNTELSRYFVFNDLSNWQPVSLSEMPIKYLTAGNGRIFYALKSYNIKAINNVYRESVHAWRTSETKGEKAKAAANVGRLIMLMTFAGATADELKDLLLGRSADTFSDNVHENLLKIFFMSRYTIDKGLSSGSLKTFLGDVLLPPTSFISDPLSDISKTLKGEPDWKTVKNLPWGKLPYEWFSTGAESAEMNRIRKKIFAKVVAGDPMGSVSEDLKMYNKWAKENGKKPISTSTLLREKQKKS